MLNQILDHDLAFEDGFKDKNSGLMVFNVLLYKIQSKAFIYLQNLQVTYNLLNKVLH